MGCYKELYKNSITYNKSIINTYDRFIFSTEIMIRYKPCINKEAW